MALDKEQLAEQAQLYRQAIEQYGGIRPASRVLNVPESTIRLRLTTTEDYKFTNYQAPKPIVFRPLADRPRYFILTSAQDSTSVHIGFWKALQSYARYLGDCEIFVSGFTYNKSLFEENDKRSDKVFFSKDIDPYITHERILMGNDQDGIEFCGEMNTLPTAVRPLSGFQNYTKHRWGVFPHTKVQLESVPTMKASRSKQIMTTGAVTLPNYIRKKAGIKGMFHHVIGAVLIELCPDGSTFGRHLLAKSYSDGTFYDLDRKITPYTVESGHSVEGLSYGDIHHEKLDPVVARATWGYDRKTMKRIPGYDCLASFLDPKYEFFHDLSDFAPRNHHNIKDHHFRFTAHQQNGENNNVETALNGCATFLKEVFRRNQIVVESNHDQAMVKWLKTADYRDDPENAVFFLECQSAFYRQLQEGVSCPPIFEQVLRKAGCPVDTVFVNEDSSFIICDDIECGMHGHLGANGARATPGQFVRSGMKSNTGHTHSPGIFEGGYVGGLSALMDLGYNKGLSSWAHAHILTYPNGKRAILTMCNGRFHAADRDHRELFY